MRRTALVLLTMSSGCAAPYAPGTLLVSSLEITNVTSDQFLANDLEVEVYLMARTTSGNEAIACAGPTTGLEVERSDVLYRDRAHFITVQPGVMENRIDRTPVMVDDLRTYDLFVAVVEDDDDECPTRPTYDDDKSVVTQNRDDLIGASEGFDLRSAEERTVTLSFGDVVEIGLEAVEPAAE